MKNSKLYLPLLLLLFAGMAAGQWKTTRTYRGPGAPAANMCQDSYDLGIVYTDYTPGGKTYTCHITAGGAHEWHSGVVANPIGTVAIAPTLPESAIVTSAATSLDLAATHNGKVLRFTADTDVTLNLSSAVAVAGFSALIVQRGAGAVTPTAGAGVTIRQRQGYTKTAGQYAIASLVCDAAGDCILSGDVQ